ncbi:unnamed protein product, partial [Brassica oleracea var. botrytis]
ENVVEGEVNVTGNSSVGALLAELEALPVSKLANGVVAYQLANAVEVIELEAGKMNEGGENQGCKEIPSRNLPSLDDPEVEKTSFDVASASDTVSPSLFKVLETLNEENELLVDGEFLVEDEDTMVDESAKEGHDRVLATKKHHSRCQDYLGDQSGMRQFQELVSYCNLLDLPYVGSVFTWWKKRGLDPVGKKLDRALIN